MADDEPTVDGGAESKPNLSLELIVKDQQGAEVTPFCPPPLRSLKDGTACCKLQQQSVNRHNAAAEPVSMCAQASRYICEDDIG